MTTATAGRGAGEELGQWVISQYSINLCNVCRIITVAEESDLSRHTDNDHPDRMPSVYQTSFFDISTTGARDGSSFAIVVP